MRNVIPSSSRFQPGNMPLSFFPDPAVSSPEFEQALEPAELLVAPAVSYHQHRACSALVRRMYAWRGYKMSAARQIIEDNSSAGLLADNLYSEELAKLRKPSHVLCEVTRLAVDVDSHDPELLKSLFRSSYKYARAIFGVTDVVIEVNPRHATYYRREFGFSQIGTVRTCPRVDAPAVLLHRSLGNLRF